MPVVINNDAVRTTITVDDDLWEKAVRATGAKTNKALVESGLRALIDQEARKRAIALGGSMPEITMPHRRKSR